MISVPLACAACAANYQGEEGGNAIGLSILFLLVVILAVIGSVLFLMIRLVRREGESLDGPGAMEVSVNHTLTIHSN